MTHTIPVGTSEAQDFQLLDRGAVPTGDATGYDIELEIARKLAGGLTEEVETPPTVAWLNPALWTVRVIGVESLTIGNYLVRYRVTDLAAKEGFFPNGEKADLWKVVKIPAV